MGFFDSIKGFGAGVFDVLTQGVQAVLPSFIEAGAGALFGGLFPNQRPAGSQVFRRPVLGPTAGVPLLLPPGSSRQLPGSFVDPGRFQQNFFPASQPFSQVFPQAAQPFQLSRGAQMPHFPGDALNVTTAGFDLPAIFDIPGIDLQLPFRPDARTGGTPFFLPTRTVGNRPRSLIMVPNPSTGAPTFFKHAGRPILFSGDFRAAKLVRKLASRAKRSSPRR